MKKGDFLCHLFFFYSLMCCAYLAFDLLVADLAVVDLALALTAAGLLAAG